MDSVISSIFWAYFMTQKSQDRTFFPVINFERKQFSYKLDIKKVLTDLGLNTQDLLFLGELTKDLLSDSDLYLVDFNQLEEGHSYLGPNVKGIIDHHEKVSNYPNSEIECIEKSCSALSLVCLQYEDQLKDLSVVERNSILSVLYLDSGFWNEKLRDFKFFG